jgi:hypothetical protein
LPECKASEAERQNCERGGVLTGEGVFHEVISR